MLEDPFFGSSRQISKVDLAGRNSEGLKSLENGVNWAINDVGISSSEGHRKDLYESVFANQVTDLNDPPKALIFKCISDANGFPAGLSGNNGLVFYGHFGNEYAVMMVISFGADKIAIRRKRSSASWSEWKYFTAS